MRRWRDPYAKTARRLKVLARRLAGKPRRTTDREVLASRVTIILRAMGYDTADAAIAPSGIERVYAGHDQRSKGAWSWATTGRLSVGSQFPMKECARAVLVVTQSVDQYSVDPIDSRHYAPPAGASFGIAKRWDVKIVDWHDATGQPLGAAE